MAVPWVEGDRFGHTGHVAARLAMARTPRTGQGAGYRAGVTDLVLGGARGAMPTQPQSLGGGGVGPTQVALGIPTVELGTSWAGAGSWETHVEWQKPRF